MEIESSTVIDARSFSGKELAQKTRDIANVTGGTWSERVCYLHPKEIEALKNGTHPLTRWYAKINVTRQDSSHLPNPDTKR